MHQLRQDRGQSVCVYSCVKPHTQNPLFSWYTLLREGGCEALITLPELASAVVPEQKIVDYLLSFGHPDGRSKALFFSRFGFSVTQWQVFAAALRQHAAIHEVTAMEMTPFGTRYVIEGILATPDGRNPSVRTVWFITAGDSIPRLVTAYPHP